MNNYFFFLFQKTNPDINELHYGATLLDLLYGRAQIYDHDIDIEQIRNLLEKGANLFSSALPIFPCLLINDCPQFYLTLIEYNCSSISEKKLFIFHLLKSISIHRDNVLVSNKKAQEFISICEYFLNVVQLAHYYYKIERFYSIIDQHFFPQLNSEQPSEQVEILRKQLNDLRSTPLKLSEIARKLIHINVNIPAKNKFQKLGLTGHLVNFLVQSTF